MDNDHEDGENVQPDNSGLKRGAGDAEVRGSLACRVKQDSL